MTYAEEEELGSSVDELTGIRDRQVLAILREVEARGALTLADARRIEAAVRDGGRITANEKKDVQKILASTRFTIDGHAKTLLETLVGFIRKLEEPAAAQLLLASQLSSPHVRAGKTYRAQSVPLDNLAAAIPASQLALLRRAASLSNNTSGRASVQDLLAMEATTLLPAERAELPALWALFEVAEVNYPIPQLVRPHASELVRYLGRPAGVKNVSSKELPVAQLPAALQSLAQRSRLLAQGSTASLSTVTISDVEKVLNTAALASQLRAAEQQSARQLLIPEIRGRHLTLMPFTEAFSVVLPEPASEQLNLGTTGPVTWSATTNLSLNVKWEDDSWSSYYARTSGYTDLSPSLWVNVDRTALFRAQGPADAVVMLLNGSGHVRGQYTAAELNAGVVLPTGAFGLLVFSRLLKNFAETSLASFFRSVTYITVRSLPRKLAASCGSFLSNLQDSRLFQHPVKRGLSPRGQPRPRPGYLRADVDPARLPSRQRSCLISCFPKQRHRVGSRGNSETVYVLRSGSRGGVL